MKGRKGEEICLKFPRLTLKGEVSGEVPCVVFQSKAKNGISGNRLFRNGVAADDGLG
jgi:hypothetical protein